MVNAIFKLFVVIPLFLGFVAFIGISCEDRATISEIRDGNVNPPPAAITLGKRQNDFNKAFIDDLLHAEKALKEISSMPTGSAGIDEKKKRAKESFYASRHKKWNSLVTPVVFKNFYGEVIEFQEHDPFGGPNDDIKMVRIKIKLFGSGIELEDKIAVDPRKNEWKARGISADWLDVEEDQAVRVSGKFYTYSESRLWAMCCVAGTSWPSFNVDFKDIAVVK